MKTKLEIFSTEELKNFFINFHEFFNISARSLVELETSQDKKNLSIVFLEDQDIINEKTIKKNK